MKDQIQLFEEKKVRSVWDDEAEEWYFSIVDIVEILSDSKNPTDYLKKMRKRDEGLAIYIGTNCPQISMLTSTGKHRKTLAGTTKDILRVVQSIPSSKAEPFKQWLAQVGAERINETIDPELAINRAKEDYRKKGYDDAWINQRIQGIKTRNELTDAWKENGVKEQKDFATLTGIIHREAFGVSIKQHKQAKGLKKENLRDNMTTLETALTMLAEATTTEFERNEKPKSMEEHRKVARAGGAVANQAKRTIEQRTGQKVVSNKNAKDLIEEQKKLTQK